MARKLVVVLLDTDTPDSILGHMARVALDDVSSERPESVVLPLEPGLSITDALRTKEERLRRYHSKD